MITVDLYLEKRNPNPRGYPVKIRVYCDIAKGHRYISTGIDQKRLFVSSSLNEKLLEANKAANYCNKLKLKLKDAVKIIRIGAPKDNALEIFLLQKRIEELQKTSGAKYLEFFDTMIEEKISQQIPCEAFKETKRQLSNFLLGEDVLINQVDYEWISSFIRYKRKLGTQRGGINFYLSTMRTVYKESQKRKSMGVKSDNPFLGLIIKSKKRPIAKHTPEDFKKIFDYSPKSGTTKSAYFKSKRNLDMTLFQFAIGGHDYDDVANLKWSNIKKGRVSFYRYKLRNNPNPGVFVDNKLNKFALTVIDKYGDNKSDRVFSYIPEPSSESYRSYQKLVIKSLKRACESIGIDKLSTKSTRFLFKSFSGEIGCIKERVMQIQGHSDDSIPEGYQRRFSNELIDEEMKKIWDLVF